MSIILCALFVSWRFVAEVAWAGVVPRPADGFFYGPGQILDPASPPSLPQDPVAAITAGERSYALAMAVIAAMRTIGLVAWPPFAC
jgi:hypothetical protein